MAQIETTPRSSTAGILPGHRQQRLGFLGVGWIGMHRLKALAGSGTAEVIAVADANPAALAHASQVVPHALVASSLDALLDLDVDGIVIATPSALHAKQAIAALERGKAVFCQKPLARTAAETRQIVEAARRADRLLGVDFSYRHIGGVPQLKQLVQSGQLGTIYAIDLVFHNAAGPDKLWFCMPELSGGGCVIDLGVHLVDLALWMLDFPAPGTVSSRLYTGGELMALPASQSEDYALAQMNLSSGATIRLACSWKAFAGRSAVVEFLINGTQGCAALRNIDGSYSDFVVECYRGTSSELISAAPDAWGARGAIDWAEQLARGSQYDHRAETYVELATVIDRIYGR